MATLEDIENDCKSRGLDTMRYKFLCEQLSNVICGRFQINTWNAGRTSAESQPFDAKMETRELIASLLENQLDSERRAIAERLGIAE